MRAEPRMLRSSRKRKLLWASTGGKCKRCGAKIDASFHADHIVPYRISGRTNVHEMQPYCAKCNLEKGGDYE